MKFLHQFMTVVVRSSALLLAALFFALPAAETVSAAGSVSYEGQSEGFVFSPGSEQSPSDLFGSRTSCPATV